MNCDILVAGVGGQGVLSVAAAIATAALEEGLEVLQSEVHGMSQRGGAVTAALRLSDKPISSPQISSGSAALLISMEPLEALRYLDSLSPDGLLITATEPVRNMANYPDAEGILTRLRALPHAILVDAEGLAREAGNARASNMVLVGAASAHLPLKPASLEAAVARLFARKGQRIVDLNRKALEAGRQAARA